MYHYTKPGKDDPDLKIVTKVSQLSSPHQHTQRDYSHTFTHTLSHTHPFIDTCTHISLGSWSRHDLHNASEQAQQPPIIANLEMLYLEAPSGSRDLLCSRRTEMTMGREGERNGDVKR